MEFLHRTWAEISKSALINNLKEIKKVAGGADICAVVKADAYGHSARLLAPVLEQNGADSFAVSNIEEALFLRKNGIDKPILILGYTPPTLAKDLADNNISQCVYSLEYGKALSENAKSAGVNVKIHIKLDTGMARIGFDLRDNSLCGTDGAIKAASLDNLIFKGVFTHFAAADSADKEDVAFTESQYDRFIKGIEKIKAAGLTPEIIHCDNSAALSGGKYQHSMVRPGIILYGLKPDRDFDINLNLIPVMTVKSVVSLVKTVKAGTPVSYGMTFKADRDMKIATVAAGYADGYPRKLSGKGEVLLHGKKAKIIGRICMDQFIIDVSDIKDVKMGDEVVLFGRDLPVDDIAALCDTINYEIVCGISPRVPRILAD
ncbi:MAG: alanine racemase [Clostridia bacterium]|nr:alanine racemase [Clostridia bacterium]